MSTLAITALTEAFGLVANRLQSEIDATESQSRQQIIVIEHVAKTIGCQPNEILNKLQDLLKQLSDNTTRIADLLSDFENLDTANLELQKDKATLTREVEELRKLVPAPLVD